MQLLPVAVFLGTVSVQGRNEDQYGARTRTGDGAGMQRVARIALFFSKSLIDPWVIRKRKTREELTSYLQSKFLQKLNALWAEPKLGAGIDLKFEIVTVRYITANEEAELQRRQRQLKPTNGGYSGAKAFCDWSKEQMTSRDQWNIPAYIIDGIRQADFNARTPGRAFGMRQVCDKNCVVIEGRVADWRFEPLFTNLLAHEIGHIFGFDHPPPGCRQGIMWSPGTSDEWSTCIKQKALEIFGNPWVYPCMAYQRGIMPASTVPPGRVSEEDLAVIKKNCPKGEAGVHSGYSGEMYFENGYLDLYKKAPEWWHEKNVCRWLPCRRDHQGKPVFYGLSPLTGYRCGVNKICQSETRCISAGESGCGRIRDIKATKGSFSSYNYMYDGRMHYLPNLKCSWRITVPMGQRIKLAFESMDVPSRVGCNGDQYAGDSVKVYDGYDANAARIASLCNGMLKTVKSTSNFLYITFTSDHDARSTGRGFQAVFKTDERSSRVTQTENADCDRLKSINDMYGIIASFKTENNAAYLPNTYCSWRITVHRGYQIQLLIKRMDVRGWSSNKCVTNVGNVIKGDRVTAYDGPSTSSNPIKTFCNGKRARLISSSNVMFVEFVTDSGRTSVATGFQARYAITKHWGDASVVPLSDDPAYRELVLTGYSKRVVSFTALVAACQAFVNVHSRLQVQSQ